MTEATIIESTTDDIEIPVNPVRTLRHNATGLLIAAVQPLAGVPGLTAEEQVERIDATIATAKSAIAQLNAAKAVIIARAGTVDE